MTKILRFERAKLNDTKTVNDPEVVEISSMVPMTAGKERIKYVLSSLPPHARPPSWHIVMDFDQEGDLLSYWECSRDEDGKELVGGGIGRADAYGCGRNKLPWRHNSLQGLRTSRRCRSRRSLLVSITRWVARFWAGCAISTGPPNQPSYSAR
jgi:hypothetical protein